MRDCLILLAASVVMFLLLPFIFPLLNLFAVYCEWVTVYWEWAIGP